MIKDQIIAKIATALKKVGITESEIQLDHPSNLEFGDYSTNIALIKGKELKQNPIELAEKIKFHLTPDEAIATIDVVKPGFINFKLTTTHLFKTTSEFADEKFEFPKSHLGDEKKVMVEFAHPNTHKLFHIGHLRNITTGESICRILQTAGNEVIRSNYEGDVGMHIAKCLWRLKKMIDESGQKIIEKDSLYEKIKLLGLAYSEGNTAYETNDAQKQEIIEMNKMIYVQDPKILPLWKETRQWSLDYFDEIYKRVYSHFDRFYFESESPKRAVEIISEAQDKGILEKSQGAVVFKGEKYGLDTRVFLNQLGLPTYEGKELALAEKEFCEFGNLDKCIHVVGPEQVSFFKVTFKVEELLDPQKYTDKQYHLVYGWVDLKEGKMSSRSGNVIEGTWLIDEAKKRILENFKCDENTAEILAVAAVKYLFLKNTTNNKILFNFQESLNLEGNSAPYLVYAYVRTQSVLAKSELTQKKLPLNVNEDEKILLQTLYHYYETVERAAKQLSPNFIANYLFDLAQKYNIFYQKHQILKAEQDSKQFRLTLTQAVANVLKNGLNLLGIETVNKM